MQKQLKNIGCLLSILLAFSTWSGKAVDFSDQTFLVTNVGPDEFINPQLWNFVTQNDWVALEFELKRKGNKVLIKNGSVELPEILQKLSMVTDSNNSKILPVFFRYSGDVQFLDSIINQSEMARRIFFLPQGEAWPSENYLVQSDRRILFFVEGDIKKESRILHPFENYALQISATRILPNSEILSQESNINKELFRINEFENLPVGSSSPRLGRHMIPDYVNFLLESWTKYGKKPNFISVGKSITSFDFLILQLNSFNDIRGQVRTSGKNVERVYWRNPEVLLTGGRFSFPIRGGDEMILSPFVPGYSMTPAQLIVTSEMVLPEEYSILASPLPLSQSLTAGFSFNGTLENLVDPANNYSGTNFSFSDDIQRGTVLRLPENSNILLGDPAAFGLPNSSFTVGCFVKFTDIPAFGDNAVLGNDESGYRRGMHLILRSGHPYFGLWSNDFMSEEVLKTNTWYHLTWRYIIETGQQAIFVNGKYVGGSDGHPPYSGSSDLHIGSAFSQGASLRGYIDDFYIWNRPLGNEEINRLALDEEIRIVPDESQKNTRPLGALLPIFALSVFAVFISVLLLIVFRKGKKNKKESKVLAVIANPSSNFIRMFGEFKAANSRGEDLTPLFTPKVKELFAYALFGSLRNGAGAAIADLDTVLWEGLESRKVANNRAVTLNKLRKLLTQFDSVEIVSNNGFLQLKTGNSFVCDYIETFRLCQIKEGMSRNQLEKFFHLVKEGRLLKGTEWPWLDEIRGFIGNQVMDNLLKLASIYQKENKVQEVEKVAQRILEFDDLSEEAVYFQVWAHQKVNNLHLAKFHFNSFAIRYEKSMGEKFSLDFDTFTKVYATQLQN